MFAQIQVSFAGLTDYIVSHRDFIPTNISTVDLPIYEGRQFHLLSNTFSCLPSPPGSPLSQIEINGNNIKILIGVNATKRSRLVRCTPVPPPPYPYNKIADIPALAAGTYHLSYYFIPSNVTFPPDDSDLPNFLVTDFSFSVLAATPVNSLSRWSLVVLTLLLLLIGHTGLKMQRRSKL